MYCNFECKYIILECIVILIVNIYNQDYNQNHKTLVFLNLCNTPKLTR